MKTTAFFLLGIAVGILASRKIKKPIDAHYDSLEKKAISVNREIKTHFV